MLLNTDVTKKNFEDFMIIGLFVRYFKTYQGWTYIPLSNGDKFCGLLGDNGVGKSSVLEALDCFFNVRDWNVNLQAKRSGSNVESAIAPVFLLKSDLFSKDINNGADKLGHFLKSETKSSIPAVKRFYKHRDEILKLNSEVFENRALVFASKNQQGGFSEEHPFSDLFVSIESENPDFKKNLIGFLFGLFEYIYIPQELDSETFTKLENQEIQGLMGETLNQVIENIFPSAKIDEMNRGLNDFVANLNTELVPYQYKDAKRERRSNVKKNDFYPKIIEAFFSSKVLHKTIDEKKSLEISQLSSGEKKRAIIDIAHSFLEKHSSSGQSLILAIDEPEASLHLSACYDQFETLFQISERCAQVVFATHWYGFLPIIHTGQVSVISKKNNETVIDLLDLSFYREQVKQMRSGSEQDFKSARSSKKSSDIETLRNEIILPHNVRLKSINDFIQSVIASITSDEPYHWLIVEGTSDKIYFEYHFQEQIQSNRLRIVPVGGAGEIKKIYEYLQLAHEDVKDEVKGRVFLLSDTDADLVQYDCSDDKKPIQSRRMVVSSDKIILVKANAKPVSPVTVIENALDGALYLETLRSLTSEDSNFGFLQDNELINATNSRPFSFNYLDLKNSQKDLIDQFFKEPGNKFRFAKAYVSNQTERSQVDWMKEIESFLFPML